jgi:hypothetical protein
MEWDQANIETKESSLTITDTTYELAMNRHLAAMLQLKVISANTTLINASTLYYN